jgi:hypothetical protein
MHRCHGVKAMYAIAWLKNGPILQGSWPRRIKRRKVFFMNGMRSSGSVHSDSAQVAHPKTKPFNIPGAWHEWRDV